jgi:murein DD-endopeptidase MepM/ murein hydrolase activator NlpD
VGVGARVRDLVRDRPLQALTFAALIAATAAVAAPIRHYDKDFRSSLMAQAQAAVAAPVVRRLVWEGADVDGDGRADFANPTGREPRTHDAYGYGRFGASRDGGVRHHEGVDFKAIAGQTVVAPLSGYVTKIGFAYPGDTVLKFVEITNPALHYAARVFYVNPKVEVGDSVAVGQPIGTSHTLQKKYPGGMTDHVHLELMDDDGDRFAATDVISEEYAAAD